MCTVGKVWKNWIQKFGKKIQIIHIFVHIRIKGRNDLKVESGIIKSFPDHKVVGFRSNTHNISSRKERETFLTSLSLSLSHHLLFFPSGDIVSLKKGRRGKGMRYVKDVWFWTDSRRKFVSWYLRCFLCWSRCCLFLSPVIFKSSLSLSLSL